MVITTVSRIINLILGMEKNHPLNFDWAPQNRNYKMNSYPHHFLSMLCECTISCEACMTGMEPNQQRSQIKSGIRVKIVLKQHQHSGILTEGIVKDILTNSSTHPHGIKVRLTDGKVGRVQSIMK